jgi:WD40 repeat protein
VLKFLWIETTMQYFFSRHGRVPIMAFAFWIIFVTSSIVHPGIAEVPDTLTTQRVTKWLAHPIGASAVSWAADGKYLATCGFQSKVRLWHWPSRRLVSTLVTKSDWVLGVDWLDRPRRLVVAERTGRVVVIDVKGDAERELMVGDGAAVFISVSPDRTKVGATFSNRGLQLFDLRERRLMEVAGSSAYSAFSWSPSGTRIAIAGGWGQVQFADSPSWSVRIVSPRGEPSGDIVPIGCCAWNPLGHSLATGSSLTDGVRIWDRNGTQIGRLALPQGAFPISIAWGVIFDGASHHELGSFEAQVESPSGVKWLANRSILAFADVRGYVGVWNGE